MVSFAGFFPVDDPEIVALVLVDEPSSSADSGGKQQLRFLLILLNLQRVN